MSDASVVFAAVVLLFIAPVIPSPLREIAYFVAGFTLGDRSRCHLIRNGGTAE